MAQAKIGSKSGKTQLAIGPKKGGVASVGHPTVGTTVPTTPISGGGGSIGAAKGTIRLRKKKKALRSVKPNPFVSL